MKKIIIIGLLFVVFLVPNTSHAFTVQELRSIISSLQKILLELSSLGGHNNLAQVVSAGNNMYFNSSESGCGTDSNVLMCDDFEDGDWYTIDYDQAVSSGGLLQVDGWGGTIYHNPITPPGAAVCGNQGANGSNCAATSGYHDGSIGGRNMADHGFNGGNVNEANFRLYFQPQSDYNGGHEKMFDFVRGSGTGQMVALCYNYFGGETIRCIPYLHQDDGLASSPINAWMGSNVGATLTLIPTHWYYIEMHVKLNTPGIYDGVFEWWLNDCGVTGTGCTGSPTMRGRYTDVLYRSAAEADVTLGGVWIENWANEATIGTMYYDNVKVSKVGPIGFAGSSGTVTPPPPVTPAPTVTLSASPTSITSGQSSTLTWSSTNATTCTASGGTFTGTKTTSGNQSVSPTANTTYSLSCTGAGGSGSGSATVTVTAAVTPVPTVTFSALPTSITVGQSSTLTWSSTNATSCTASNAWTGARAVSGTLSVSPIVNKTYRLTCTGAGGSAAKSVTVTVTAAIVTPAPTVTLSASPTSITSGQSSTLTWSSTNATTCTASGGTFTGTKTTSGNQSVSPTANTTYSLSCTGAGGSGSGSATVTVTAAVTPVPILPIGNNPAPQSGDSIIFDTRAGGAQSYQAMTTLAQMQAAWGDTRYTQATGFFETNVDGLGTNAHGIQWQAPSGSEQEAMLLKGGLSGPSSGWYTQWKMYLGKSPTGGGIGAWSGLGGNTAGNNHQKTMLWYRTGEANTGNTHRIYLAMRPGYTTYEIDGVSWQSAPFSIDYAALTGQIVTTTVWIQPSTGSIKTWVNGTVVQDQTGQNIGTAGLSDVVQTVTTFPAQQEVQYAWDTVVWAPGGSSTPAPTPAPTPSPSNSITTNILNGATISGSLIWTAIPTGTPTRVEFLIDGVVLTTELSAIYQFNGDPLGTLNTTTLTNGAHQLRVRAVYSDGTTAELPINVTVSNGTISPPASTKFSIGQQVQTTASLNVRGTASTAGTLLGTQATGIIGTVVGGPINADGFNWWNVNYNSGADGWSVEDYLNSYTAPTPPVTPAPITAFYSNKPANYSTLNNFDFSQAVPSPSAGRDTSGAPYAAPIVGSGGWSIPFSNVQNFSTEVDNTSPISPGTVWKLTIPPGSYGGGIVGQGGGTGFGDLAVGLSDLAQGFTSDLYISVAAKWDSNFEWHPVSNKWFELGSPNMQLLAQSNEGGNWVAPANLSANWHPGNNINNSVITGGVWHVFEFLVQRSTGTIKVWMDGNLRASYTGQTTNIPMESSNAWQEFYFRNFRGGGGETKTRNSYIWYDNIYIAAPGSNPVISPPSTLPASTKFSIGQQVQTTASLNVRGTASTAGTLLGTQATGIIGTVVGGPINADGFNWWNVNYNSGADGWSVEDYLNSYTAPPPPVTPAPTVTLSASPTSITSGQSSTLTWSSTNATTCTASGGTFTGTKTTSGNQSVSPTANTTYSLSCTGAGGSGSQSVTVSVSAVVTPAVTQTTGTCEATGSGKCYYIDPVNGNDSNPGTYSAPWRSAENIKSTIYLQYRSSGYVALQPGDIVYIRGNGYLSSIVCPGNDSGPNTGCTQVMYLRNIHGTASAPITIASYPGEQAMIGNVGKQKTVAPSGWIPVDSDYVGGITMEYSSFVTIRNITVANTTGVGIDSYDSDDILIENVTVHDTARSEFGGNPAGVKFTGGYRTKVDGSTFYDNFWDPVPTTNFMRGIGVQYFRGGDHTISNSNFYQTKQGYTNGVPQGYGECVMYKHASDIASGWFHVYNNTFKNCGGFGAIGLGTQNAHIKGNLIIDSSRTALGSEDIGGPTYQVNQLWENNTIVNSRGLVFKASVAPYNNLFPTLPKNITFRNNIVYDNAASYTGERNIVDISTYGTDAEYAATIPELNFSNNCYYNPNSAPRFGLFSASGGTFGTLGGFYTFPQWQQFAYNNVPRNYDVGSVNANPLFVNASGNNYGLQAGSPCANMGAYANSSVTPPPVVTPTQTPAPTVTLSASPTSITSGQSSTLTWSSTNATTCTASGGTFTGTKTTSGTQSVSPTANTTYSLSCTGAGGSGSQSVTVNVTAVVVPTPVPTPVTISGGGGGGGGGTSAPVTTVTTVTTPVPAPVSPPSGGGGGGGSSGTTATTIPTVAQVTQTSAPSISTTLYVGTQGIEVANLQTYLKARGLFPATEPSSGFFGPKTLQAVQAFQTSKGITPTGIVGPLTRAAIQGSSSGISVPVVSATPTPATPKFQIGNTVQTTATLRVRSSASPFGILLGAQFTGAIGKVLDGPVISGGYTWWKIDYGSGVDGWSADIYLVKSTGVFAPQISNPVQSSPSTTQVVPVTTTPPTTSPFVIGTKIITMGITTVRKDPSTDGSKLGTQPIGMQGTVIKGPVLSGGYIWWNIDYSTGVDGWSDSDYLKRQ